MSADAAILPSTTTAPAEAPPMTQRRVLGLAVPIIGENLLQTAVGAIDTLLVARLGAAAVAGVGVGFEIVFFFLSILSAVSIGTTVLVAQAIGGDDRGRAGMLARQALLWGLLLSIPVSIGGYYAAPTALRIFGAEPDVTEMATTYVQVTVAAIVSLMLSYLLGAVFRGAGDGRTPLKAAVIANIVHIGASWVLIFGHLGLPAWGVAGAAAGAAIGRGFGALFMLVVLLRGNGPISIRSRADWWPRVAVGRDIFRLGVPGAIEQVLQNLGFITIIAVVAALGTASLAAQQIGFTAMSLAFLPGIAFSITATALVGQSIGANRPDHAVEAARITRNWALIWLATGGVILAIIPARIMGLFTDDPEVIRVGVNGLRGIAASLPWWALWMVGSGALRGSGDTRGPMIRGVAVVWASALLGWIGVEYLGMGVGWVWLTFTITAPITVLLNRRAFARRMAEKTRALEHAAAAADAVDSAPVHHQP